MPEFKVTESQIIGEEFVPSRKDPTMEKKETIAEEVHSAPANGDHRESHRASLKRGRLPRARTTGQDITRTAKNVIGEVSERDSVFSDALSQKLSPRGSSASRQGKTTRILDENRQELGEELPTPTTPSRNSRPANRVRSRNQAERDKGSSGHHSEVRISSHTEPHAQCGETSSCKDHGRCHLSRLKDVGLKWWRKLVGCFHDLSGTVRNRRNRSRKDFKNSSRVSVARAERRPMEDKKRHGGYSSAAKRTRKNFMPK
jgi:hypothetical protein